MYDCQYLTDKMSVPDILPPSPPHTSHRDRMPLSLFPKVNASTPDDSPAGFLPSSGTRKKVEFSSWTNVLDAPSSDPPSESSALKALPRSKDCQPLAKSILKPYTESDIASLGLDGASETQNITMDSLVVQLAVNDKISSLDAYQSLAQLVKTYDEIPEDSDTKANVTALLKYIKRDLTVQDQSSVTPLEMNLVTQALKVSVILVWSEHLSPLITEDFKIFITDRAINSLAEHTASKIVLIHHMHLLATQNFRTVLFTSGTRTIKLLEALRELTNHVQGKGATSERLLVYQKLIEQARPIMKARANLWVKEVLIGLSSRVWEIQEKAISVGSRACAAFPLSSALSQAAREALSESIKDRTLNTVLTQRLLSMVAAKDEAIRVPQIWALIMLMCNSVDQKLENWSSLKEWLKVLQRCFNCSDVNVRTQAFPAWNRFIYIIRPHETTDVMLSMLAKPIVAQIERTNANTSSKGTRPAAISSYCILLYYAFRPAASHKQYTRAWNEYIVKVATSSFLSKAPANADLCCRALINLFWKENTINRIWNENRAHDNTLSEPEELPTIDCKWVRSKAHAIIQVFRLLFLHSSWGPSIQNAEQTFVAKSWRHFLKAIKESASKEIKASNDTRKALSSIIGFLSDVPSVDNNKTNTSNDYDTYSAHLRIACAIAVNELGAMVLLEAIELSEQTINPDLLEIVFTSVLQNDQRNTDKQQEILSPPAQRCLVVFNKELRQQYTTGITAEAKLTRSLEVCSRVLRRIQSSHTSQCLQQTQESLALVLKDHNKLYDSHSENVRLISAWQSVSDACIDMLAKVPIAEFVDLDNLLAAAVSSSNEITTNYILITWRDTDWQEVEAVLGPRLQAAIEVLQPYVDVNLPGIHPRVTACESQFPLPQAEVGSTQMTSATVPETLEQLLANIVRSREHTVQAALAAQHVNGSELTGDRSRASEAEHEPRQKLRHDDSQVQFVAVHSSPQTPAEVESQFLTERQKDVRDRQRAEQAVTFADLRSSPRSRSDRTSRAVSVDCELARKAAALQDIPVTPTLPRHTDDMDDEVMPSPTPKAKHQVLRLMDIDIASSPPSIAGDGIVDNDPLVQDEPMHESTADGLEIVRLEDDPSEKIPVLHIGQRKISLLSSAMVETSEVLETCKSYQIFGNEDILYQNIQEASEFPEIPSSISPSPRPDAEMMLKPSVSQARSALHGAEEHVTDSDELDQASASQLSQDLDWHLMETCRSGEIPAEKSELVNFESKKRKASPEILAESVTAHIQKRRGSGKGSVSLHTPNKSTPVSSPKANDKDNPVVSDTPVQPNAIGTPNRENAALVSPASSAGRSRRPKSRRGRRTPTRPHNHSPSTARSLAPEFHQLLGGVEPSADEFHTPITAQHLDEGSNIQSIIKQNEIQHLQPQRHTTNHGQSQEIDVITALRSALHILENNKQAIFELRAVDDLCFQIRFQAQENAQKREQESSIGEGL